VDNYPKAKLLSITSLKGIKKKIKASNSWNELYKKLTVPQMHKLLWDCEGYDLLYLYFLEQNIENYTRLFNYRLHNTDHALVDLEALRTIVLGYLYTHRTNPEIALQAANIRVLRWYRGLYIPVSPVKLEHQINGFLPRLNHKKAFEYLLKSIDTSLRQEIYKAYREVISLQRFKRLLMLHSE
jgi:hypothetical protein